jgi:hypothetical protein
VAKTTVARGGTPPDAESRYRAIENITLSPTGFLIIGRTGDSYTLNPVARHILGELIAGQSSEELWRGVVKKFEIDEERARRDVERFLIQLWSLGLVTRTGGVT